MKEDAPNRFYRYADLLGIIGMAYFGLSAVLWIVDTDTAAPFSTAITPQWIYYSLTTRVSFQWVWGTYAPYAWDVILFALAYALFYRKFKWFSPFMFMFVWGFNDMLYNVYYDLYHYQWFVSGALFPDGEAVYFEKMAIEAGIAIVGLILLRPKLNLKYSFLAYFGLALVIINHVYNGLIGFPILNTTPALQFQSFTSVVGLLLFLYSVLQPSKLVQSPVKPSPA